ncbi:MAG: hypothetical protein R3A45_01515 [Bdellovibrionota bacterium]
MTLKNIFLCLAFLVTSTTAYATEPEYVGYWKDIDNNHQCKQHTKNTNLKICTIFYPAFDWKWIGWEEFEFTFYNGQHEYKIGIDIQNEKNRIYTDRPESVTVGNIVYIAGSYYRYFVEIPLEPYQCLELRLKSEEGPADFTNASTYLHTRRGNQCIYDNDREDFKKDNQQQIGSWSAPKN